MIALHSLHEPKENTFVCVGEIFTYFIYFFIFLSFLPLAAFLPAEEHAVVDGDIITQSGVCGQFPVIWTFA